MEKLRYWLRGCPRFTVRTDQVALAQIYNSKSLDELPEEIAEIVISTYRYNFDVQYVPGKKNLIADYLSRNPLWEEDTDNVGPTIINDFGHTVSIEAHVHSAGLHNYAERIYCDPML